MDSTYRFILESQTGQLGTNGIPNGAESIVPSGATPSDGSEGLQVFVAKTAQKGVQQAVINPLNQATGGLASPAIKLGKAIGTGAGAAAIAGPLAMLAVAGVNLAINAIEKRISELEAQVDKFGERDNLLIRAGYAGDATFYEYNFFTGVHKTDRR